MIVHLTRDEVADLPAAGVITPRGKELDARDTAADAQRLLTRDEVSVLPVLGEGGRYLGSVDRETLIGADPATPAAQLADDLLPTAAATEPASRALEKLDAAGASRLAVLDDDGRYVGMVCLRSDRRRMCIDLSALDAS